MTRGNGLDVHRTRMGPAALERIEVREVAKRRSRSPLKRINPWTILKAAINRLRQPVIDSLEVRGVPLVVRPRLDSGRPSSFDFAAARGIRDARREFGHHILSDNLAKMERQQASRGYASSFHNTRASATAGATAAVLTTALSQGLIVGLGVSAVCPPAGPIAGAVVVVVSAAAAIAGSRRYQHIKAYNDAKSTEIRSLFAELSSEGSQSEGLTLHSSRTGDDALRRNLLRSWCQTEHRDSTLAQVIRRRVEADLKDADRWQERHPVRTAAPMRAGSVSGAGWPTRASTVPPSVPSLTGARGQPLPESSELRDFMAAMVKRSLRTPPQTPNG